MKKIISLMLALSLVFSFFTVSAAEKSEKVEIAFKVGDDTLSINGQDVKVETPYIVGEGVTLVPLRVITEAFGAKVDWEGETKTITLTYSDVVIILQINNPIAEVNKKAETLLSAPELTKNGVTMVPLRFISETFGATVGYDDKTAKITVVKDGSGISGDTVKGAIDSKRVGDSYYGWSIDNPTDMTMNEREFDGTYTEYAFNEDDGFYIFVDEKDEDYNFEREFKSIKDSLAAYTLIKADKDTSDESKKTMHFKAKNTNVYVECIAIECEKYIYEIFIATAPESTENTKYIENIVASFETSFGEGDVYDLSNVKGDMREYKSEAMKFSMEVPANYYMESSEEIENEVVFAVNDEKDKQSCVSIGIYSKSEVGSAKDLANKDFKRNSSALNKNITTIAEFVTERKYEVFDAYEYSYTIKSDAIHYLTRDVFFEIGDYVYNVAVRINKPQNNADPIIDKILNTIKAEPLDKEKTGILMRNDNDYEGTFTYKGDGFKLTVPNSYTDTKAKDGVVLANAQSGALMMMSVSNSSYSYSNELKKYVEAVQSSIIREDGVEIVERTWTHKIGKLTCAEFLYKITEGESVYYTRAIFGIHGGKMYTITVSINEVFYTEALQKECEEIISSITFE